MISFNGIELDFSNMGMFSTESTWIHPKRVIDSYEMIYCLEGSFYIKEGDIIYYIEPGTLFFLHPNIQHMGYRKTNTRIKFYWLHFHCENFSKLKLNKKYSAKEIRNCEYLFQEINNLQGQELNTPEAVQNNHLLLDIKTLEIMLKLQSMQNLAGNKRMLEIIEYIRINSNTNLRVSDVAERFKYSEGYLSRMFTKTLGVPLRNYIITARVNYIKSLLSTSIYSIKEIAELCGFWHENNFVKFFKYNTKMTPTEYRNLNGKTHQNNH